MALTPGSRLGQYEILSAIGAGGMGEVYRARDPRLGRDVAIKVLSGELARDPSAAARFEHEAMSVAKLSHPNIVSIFEFAREGEVAFVVTELVDGMTLRERLAGGALPSRRAVAYALQIAGDRRRPRPRHRPSRSQARERHDHAGRSGQDSRLRSRKVAGRGRNGHDARRGRDDERRYGAGDAGLHVAGAASGP